MCGFSVDMCTLYTWQQKATHSDLRILQVNFSVSHITSEQNIIKKSVWKKPNKVSFTAT